MKVKLTRKRKVYGRRYAKGSVVEVPQAFGKRLVYIGDAKPSKGKVSKSEGTPLPRGVPKLDLLKNEGLETVEDVQDADLTEINGIGKATEKHIKDALG